MRLIVGPERHWRHVLARAGGADLIVLRSPDAVARAVAGFRRRLELRFNDIAAPQAGFVAPDAAMVGELLAFGRGVTTAAILCYAGISRSTAAAYVLACQARPGAEAALAHALRGLAPSATPNPLIVALADSLLGRDGRMVRAIAAIGRGADAFEGGVFDWQIADHPIAD